MRKKSCGSAIASLLVATVAGIAARVTFAQEVEGMQADELASIIADQLAAQARGLWEVKAITYVWSHEERSKHVLAVFEPRLVADNVCEMTTITLYQRRERSEWSKERGELFAIKKPDEQCESHHGDYRSYTTIFGEISAEDYVDIVNVLNQSSEEIRNQIAGFRNAESNTAVLRLAPGSSSRQVAANVQADGCEVIVSLAKSFSDERWTVSEVGDRTCGY